MKKIMKKSMKKNRLIYSSILALASVVFVSSCQDDFSEGDLLELQNDLAKESDSIAAAKSLEALNAAGEMVSFQFKVVDTDGLGVEGLNVSMVAAAESGTADNQTLVTDASGSVFFDRVAVGGNTVTVSGESIIDVTLNVDFGQIQEGKHFQIVDQQIIPTPVTENAIITVLGGNSATATVKGVATIETDLTNDTKEVPQDIRIMANFDDSLVSQGSVDIDYFYATNDNALSLGSAMVDNATGEYTMEVPAGVNFDLMVPEVQAEQRLAINGVDGKDLDQPEYRNILTSYGPQYGTDFIPTVPGARIVFDQPESAGGEGFTLALSKVGRTLPVVSISSSTPQINNYMINQFTNRGSGYIASPKVSVSDPTGYGAYVRAEIRVNSITGATLANAGTGYVANTEYDFDFEIDYTNANGDIFTYEYPSGDNLIAVTTNGTGEFTQAAFDNALSTATGNFFDNPISISNFDVVEMRIVQNDNANGDAVYIVTAANSEVFEIQVIDGGEDYTGPSFTFDSGSAAITTHAFGTQWRYDVDNSGVTAPYTLVPSDISIHYQPVSTASVWEDYDYLDMSDFTVDANGNVQFKDPLADDHITEFFSSEMPRITVVEPESTSASKYINSFDINEDGQVEDISTYSDELNDFSNSNGEGYTDNFGAAIVPTIEGAPGSGATIEITDGIYYSNGEYQWFGDYIITDQGSGYLQNLNVQNSTSSYSLGGDATNVTLEEGTTHVVNIRYGTGNKSEDVY